MHEVYFNTKVNFALQCVCIYRGLYTNICLQCYLKGPMGMNTEYILVVQQKRIWQAGEKEGKQYINKKKRNN